MPRVLAALDPGYAVEFMFRHGSLGFFSLGAVVLVVTGAEALYADMGHFGRVPVRLAWMLLVLPSLTLNYFGQGALLIADAKAIENPFYLLAPEWALYPLVVLSTIATVIASQAVISGAFSITQQAMQLGYSPRMAIQHTSSRQIGQIYLPGINWALFLGVVVLVVGFKSSTNLAAAYGIAVTGTMAITTILAYVVARSMWKWSVRGKRGAVRRLPADRPRVLQRQHPQGQRRRLVPAGVRPRRVHADVDVEARPPIAAVAAGGRLDSRSTPSSRARRWAARPCPAPPCS